MSDLSRQTAVPDAEINLAAGRTRLAYDRTMPSWIRTATALITFGFSIHQFFQIANKEVVERTSFIGPYEFGMLMIVVGLLALLLATLEHRSAIHALQAEYPKTKPYGSIHRSLAVVLAALVSILGLLALFSMLVR